MIVVWLTPNISLSDDCAVCCICGCRWIALPEDAQEEAAAITGFQPLAAEALQPLDLYSKATSFGDHL